MRQPLVGGRSFSSEESRPAPEVGAALQFSIFGGKAPVALRPPPFRQGRLPCLVPGSRPIRARAGSARKPRAGPHRPEPAPVRATASANGKPPRKRRQRGAALERREACVAPPPLGGGSSGGASDKGRGAKQVGREWIIRG